MKTRMQDFARQADSVQCQPRHGSSIVVPFCSDCSRLSCLFGEAKEQPARQELLFEYHSPPSVFPSDKTKPQCANPVGSRGWLSCARLVSGSWEAFAVRSCPSQALKAPQWCCLCSAGSGRPFFGMKLLVRSKWTLCYGTNPVTMKLCRSTFTCV